MTQRDGDPRPAPDATMGRREAIKRVSLLLGGFALAGSRGGRLLRAVSGAHDRVAFVSASVTGVGDFTAADVAFLDEIADTMLPDTKTPGAKAAKVGAFMAVMVTDSYGAKEQQIFRDGMVKINAESRKAHGLDFMHATPQQRLALLERLDSQQKAYMDRRDAARKAKKKAAGDKSDAFLPDERKENTPSPDASAASAITADSPSHYFRLMKELALLGYFTSEIGCTQALRYVETPAKFQPCVPYTPGERAWASHA